MDSMLDNLSKNEFISICIRDPRLVREDHWHTHVDYEICLHTNSMCFRKKTSTVRRRYSEFVWLRHSLEQNALIIELPKLPPWNPFFSLRNTEQVLQRMKGMQEFLEIVLHAPLLLSDSRLHLFLQSDLSTAKIEKCALGKMRYTVAEAIQCSSSSDISRLGDKASGDSECERCNIERNSLHFKELFSNFCCRIDPVIFPSCSSTSSSGLGVSVDSSVRESPLPFESSDRDPELCGSLSES
uniref:PX domain-containing protein n=1 Tax=Mola mola TaxID=94237 RepID=A0A3Q3VWJ8_MOLML